MALSAAGLFLLSRITENSSLALVLAGLILLNGGVGTFESSNNSSILNSVDQRRYGVVSGLLSLVRNAGNVTGIAVGTAIVAAVMISWGFPPSLETVSDADGSEVFRAFTAGLRTTYLAMGCLLLLGIVVSFLKGGRTPRYAGPSGRGASGRAESAGLDMVNRPD